MAGQSSFRRWIWAWLIGYALFAVAVVWSVLAARSWALTELATPESTAEWEAWREDVRAQQNTPAPIRRRVPKSAEPPALVLARDYFAIVMTAAVVFSSLIYWVLAWMISGTLTSASNATSDHPASLSADQARRERGHLGS
jgi:hypothetical protein